VPADLHVFDLAAHGLLDALMCWLRPMFACSWMRQIILRAPAALSFSPAARPADRLALADVRDRAEGGGLLGAEVERDQEDLGLNGLLDCAHDRVRVRH
jgi:hypothetical protein